MKKLGNRRMENNPARLLRRTPFAWHPKTFPAWGLFVMEMVVLGCGL